MSSFDYHATQADGQEVSGRIEAADDTDARRLLAAQGLTVSALTLVAEATGTAAGRPLSTTEAGQFAGHLAQLGATGLPVEAGLRAAAAEVENPRIANALNYLANQLGQGTSLESAIAQPGCHLPGHVSGLVAAAARTGRPGTALAELLEHQREVQSLRSDAIRGLAYPLFVVGVACAVIFVIMFGVAGVFQQMFIEFQIELPGVTKLVFWWRDIGIWVLLAACLFAVALAVVTRIAIGEVAWMRLISTVPILGRMSYWSGLAEWTSLMSVLIHHDVPLPEALRLSASGVRNAFVGNIVNALALANEQGATFSDSLVENRDVPASLVPLIRWGERTGALSEAFVTTRDLLARRVRVRALLLKAALPPLLFILIVCQVGAMVMAIFLPLVSLVQGLS